MDKEEVIQKLREAGVKAATVTYYGANDEGGEIDIRAEGADGVGIHLEDSLANAVEAFVDNLQSEYHAGFENDDGGGGAVVFDVDSGEVTYSRYNLRVVEDYEEPLKL